MLTGKLDFTKQRLLALVTGEIHTVIVVTSKSHSHHQTYPKEKEKERNIQLDSVIDQRNLPDIDRASHPPIQNTHASQQSMKFL